MGDCIFCDILEGEIPSRTVHETDETFAFLDVNPLARGHTLVIPKAHHARVGELPGKSRDALFGAVGRLTPAVESAVDADAMTVAINDGAAAGQEVPHVHAHLVPRYDDDGAGPIHALDWPQPDMDDGAFDEVLASIRAAL